MKLWIYALVLSFVLMACQEEQEVPLAKVGDTVLTLREFQSQFPQELYDRMSHSQKVEMLARWIDREVLYQEGVSEGLDQEEKLLRQVQNFKQKIISEQFVEQEIASLPEPVEQELKMFYQNHPEKYLRPGDRWDYHRISMKSGKLAWDLFKALKKSNFKKSLNWMSKNSAYKIVAQNYHEPSSNCIVKLLNKTSEGRVSTPEVCERMYSLVYREKKYAKGLPLSYEEVKDLVLSDFIEARGSQFRQELKEESIAKAQIVLNHKLLEPKAAEQQSMDKESAP